MEARTIRIEYNLDGIKQKSFYAPDYFTAAERVKELVKRSDKKVTRVVFQLRVEAYRKGLDGKGK